MNGRIRSIVLLLAALMLIGVAPAGAGGNSGLKATFEGGTIPPGPPIDCPADAEWRFGGFGGGAMTTAAYSGEFSYEFTHCSRWVTNPMATDRTDGKFVGKSDAGVFTIVVTHPDDGVIGTLVLGYEATWVFEGSLAGDPPDFVADIHGRYTVDHGTGIFADARGHGRLLASGGIFLTGVINGSLK